MSSIRDSRLIQNNRTQGRLVFALTGTWQVDAVLDSDQLAHIAETVKQQAGFVRGFWGQEIDDTVLAHAFVVFKDDAAAQDMAQVVKAAIPSASLRVFRVLTEA